MTGDLYIGDGSTTGSVEGNINNSGAVLFMRSDNYTYTGIISGTGAVYKGSTGKTTLTGVNDYKGATTVANGILQIGDGTSGSIANTASVEVAENAVLRFEPGINMTFDKVISGDGSVIFRGETSSTKQLFFTANHIYTGTTTIEQGRLNIGQENYAGAIDGNIENNGRLPTEYLRPG